MSLRDHGISRRQLRQGSGRGNGDDHVDGLIGCTELYIYQTPNKQPKGFQPLKTYLEAQGCEVIFTAEAPPELAGRYETMRVTCKGGEPIPPPALKRCHAWAHGRNFLHSFFKPMYR